MSGNHWLSTRALKRDEPAVPGALRADDVTPVPSSTSAERVESRIRVRMGELLCRLYVTLEGPDERAMTGVVHPAFIAPASGFACARADRRGRGADGGPDPAR